jgi:SAM-dependent methyltransferase
MWAEITGDMHRASMLLADSPHVKFLEQYLEMSETIFLRRHFQETFYYKNALEIVQISGHYFGQRTIEGITEQARAFSSLYQRMLEGDSIEVKYPSSEGHSPPQSLPVVRQTWTPKTFQVEDGMHRLAVMWILGYRRTRAEVLPPAAPTALQNLVVNVGTVQQRSGLYQPIDGAEFDASWTLHRRCHDRLEMMLRFLSSNNLRVGDLSVLDLGCSYGWFTAEFSKRGASALGLDINLAALKIGQIAYGLPAERLFQDDLLSFLCNCDRTYDVVLLLSVLHHFALKPDFGRPEEIVQRVDAVTGTVLFVDTGQAHEARFCHTLPQWDNAFIIDFIKQHTSFNRVIPLGVDSDSVGLVNRSFGRTLFACVRS